MQLGPMNSSAIHPSAIGRAYVEGLSEMFTINRLRSLPPRLTEVRFCRSTNLIDSTRLGRKTEAYRDRVTNLEVTEAMRHIMLGVRPLIVSCVRPRRATGGSSATTSSG